jgi:hypothetical protein
MISLQVYIAHYGNKNHNYLLQVIDNFYNYSKFSIDLFIDYAKTDLDVKSLLKKYTPKLNLFFQKHDPEIGEKLVFCHRKEIVKGAWCEANDYILYCEDDILIPEEALLAAILSSGGNQVCGFLRYEEKDGQKYLIDLRKDCPTIDKIEKDYFTLYNLHQGCWLLSKGQVQKSIDFFGKNFYIYLQHPKYGCLEQGATGLFLENDNGEKLFEKKYPKTYIDELLIHHLPDKYVNFPGEWQNPGCMTVNELKTKIT